jgi:fatty acid-binding protein DegV
MKKALGKQVDQIVEEHGEGAKMRFQIMHADAEDYGNTLRDMLSARFDCVWMPTTSITPLVGAHAGPGLTGVVYAPESVFHKVP